MISRFFTAIIVFVLMTSNVSAQQWAPVGDSNLRRDVELLKTYNIIQGPVNTWPMSWRQITNNINISMDQALPAHLTRAIERVRSKIPNKGLRGSATLRYTNEPSLVRSFSDTARSDADMTVSAGLTEKVIDVNVSLNYRDNVNFDNSNINFDNSYIATNLENWSLYAGAIDRWWGPGQENTLLLSSNARPMISAGLRRIDPKPFKSKWLSWMGPWTWDMFVSNMEKDRHIPNALMAGMRLGLEPIRNFEVGLSRTMQLCGEGRPCGADTWARSIIGIWDLDNTGTANEPGNQLASIDLSYSMNFGDKSLKIYAEGTAEDEWKILPYQYSRLIGSSLTMPIGDRGDSFKINAELSDSGNVRAWLFGERRAGVMYGHFIYKTGHRYNGRTLGHSFDNDSKLASFTATYIRSSGDSYRISLRAASINWDDTNKNIVSAHRQNYQSVELLASKRLLFGHVEAKMNFQSKAVTLTQSILPRFVGGLTWRIDI
ncbi:capsule assembly Wzi family protein [Emcibacteraceae bacterium]|nr:capsule assembly Wzi family protein [Emcibacteraceae bacterium]